MPGRGLDAQTGLQGISEEVTFELGLKGLSVGPREVKRGQGTAAKRAVGAQARAEGRRIMALGTAESTTVIPPTIPIPQPCPPRPHVCLAVQKSGGTQPKLTITCSSNDKTSLNP